MMASCRELVHDALFQTSDVSAGCERPSWSDWPERPTRNHSKCIPYYIPAATYVPPGFGQFDTHVGCYILIKKINP